ncbi:MAG: M23 family metallopeptidase [Clostridia bacterium]
MEIKSSLRKIRFFVLSVVSLVLILAAVTLTILNTYKPTYKVTINGQFVGYFLNQQQFDEKYNVLVNEKAQIDENVKVYLETNPLFEKTYVKETLLDEENLYTNLRAQLKTEHTVYAVLVNEEKKMTFNSKDDATNYSEKLKSSATNVATAIKEEKVEEIDELTSVEVANAIVKDVVAKTKPVVVAEPPKPAVVNRKTNSVNRGTSNITATAKSNNAYGIWPTSSRYVSCGFGGYYGHTGMDIAGRRGDPNKAFKSGKVVFAGWDSSGYGYLVKLDHGNGIQSWYAHNCKLLVSVGQYVDQGQSIGLQGSTGNSTGNHLHFEIRLNGRAVNPYGYIAAYK